MSASASASPDRPGFILPSSILLAGGVLALVAGIILLVVIAVFVRIAVSQSSRRSLAPAVAIVAAALVLLGAYVIWREQQPPSPTVAEARP